MLIDPDGKNLSINVDSWKSGILNDFDKSIDFRGYNFAYFKGNIHKFTCTGTIYGDNKDNTIKYLEMLSFDDAIEISLDINDDVCNFQDNTIDPRLTTINGFIIISSFEPDNVYGNASSYTLNGYFFPQDSYRLKTIDSYFNLGPVSSNTNDGSISGSNDILSIAMNAGLWSNISVSTAGGINFALKPSDYKDCYVRAEILDSGNNVAKWQINTLLEENGAIIDISFIVLNRGGVKIMSNIAWEIQCSGYSKSIFKSFSNLCDYSSELPSSIDIDSTNVLLIGSGVANLSNYGGIYWDDDPLGNPSLFTGLIKTKQLTGNIISISSSNQNVIQGSSGGSNLSTGLNINVISPYPGSNVDLLTEGADNVCYVPVEFCINDSSRVSSIQIFLKLNYSSTSWSFGDETETITYIDATKYNGGGFINAKFIMPSGYASYQKHAGIEIIVTYDGGNHEHGILKYTFSIGMDPGMTLTKTGGNGPIKAAIDLKYQIGDYPIFSISDFSYGIYDLYFYYNVNYGRCVVDTGLYSSTLQGAYNDEDITEFWRTTLENFFVATRTNLPTNTPTMGSYNCIDYNGGGMHYIARDLRNIDQGVPSVFISKRTVIIKNTTDTHIHARLINYGSSPITGFSVVAVPVYSHTNGLHFIGDCINALTPNIKNKVLIPID